MDNKIFNCDFSVKEVTESGQFEGHAAVFGNVDRQRDRIRRGAFKQSIEETGGKWPVLMGHDMGRVVGFSTEAKEDSKGLWVAGEFTLASDEGRNAHAVASHAASLNQKFGLSIGYGIPDGGADYDGESGIRVLKNITVYEFSMAAVPANDRARLLRVKDMSSIREAERFLRQYMTHDEARDLIAIIKADREVTPNHNSAPDREVKEHYRREMDEFLSGLRGSAFQSQLKEFTL